jgi:putative endonuclease
MRAFQLADHKKIYIGQTKDLENRFQLHKKAIFKNSYTSRFSGHWVVIYTERAIDRTAALQREKQLKSYRGREFVKTHIPR